MLEGLGYVADPLDRVSDLRGDASAVAALRARDDAQAIMIARDMPILRRVDGRLEALSPIAEVHALGGAGVEVLLGVLPDGAPVFAALLSEDALVRQEDDGVAALDRRELIVPDRDDLTPVDIRSIAASGLVPSEEEGMLASAKAVLGWHGRRKFCSNCGSGLKIGAAGWRLDCPHCHMQHFPRTDPVVIMLAVEGDHCLLGRQPRFPKRMYSALAGFLEPGETIEQAVRREIKEEAGIACGEVRYFASQPWPFPSSLMIGCFVEARSREIVVDRLELEDARWFSRDEVRSMLEKRHPDRLSAPVPMAIAHHLIKAWAAADVEFNQPRGL